MRDNGTQRGIVLPPEGRRTGLGRLRAMPANGALQESSLSTTKDLGVFTEAPCFTRGTRSRDLARRRRRCQQGIGASARSVGHLLHRTGNASHTLEAILDAQPCAAVCVLPRRPESMMQTFAPAPLNGVAQALLARIIGRFCCRGSVEKKCAESGRCRWY